jgi:cytoskeletal protein RodZ
MWRKSGKWLAMPLDSGAVASFDALGDAGYARAPGEIVPITLNPAGDVGSALREVREARGLSLEQVSATTRVRPAHIAAIESLDLAALPSRPFAIGYVRAYAQALKLDAEAVVARFKLEAPDPESGLRAPVGVRHEARPRFGSLAAMAVVLALAVVGWNIARHAMSQAPREGEETREIASAAPPRPTDSTPTIGAPLPAPPEASTPDPYVTPGLEAANAAGGSADAAIAAHAAAQAAATKNVGPVGHPFVAAGTIYGDAATASGLILQAKRPTPIIVHSADGKVYFARQLAAGEAWRAPALKGLIVDTGNPADLEAFVGGVSKGVLTQPTTPLSTLGG